MSPLLHRILSPAECFEVSALLEAKYLALRALPAPEPDNARVAREAAEAYTREVLAPHLVAEGYGEELLNRYNDVCVTARLVGDERRCEGCDGLLSTTADGGEFCPVCWDGPVQ